MLEVRLGYGSGAPRFQWTGDNMIKYHTHHQYDNMIKYHILTIGPGAPQIPVVRHSESILELVHGWGGDVVTCAVLYMYTLPVHQKLG